MRPLYQFPPLAAVRLWGQWSESRPIEAVIVRFNSGMALLEIIAGGDLVDRFARYHHFTAIHPLPDRVWVPAGLSAEAKELAGQLSLQLLQ